MGDRSQETLATILENAWAQTQAVRERSGIVIELRFTTLGLTVVSNDFLCGRMVSISWSDLRRADDLAARLSDAIEAVADQPRRDLRAPHGSTHREPAPAAARSQEAHRRRRSVGRSPAKTSRAERKRSQG
ncbi:MULTISPECIES: hypothetical protein [Methylobacterium]|uniref:hypothetical protein n=1 Tax=Methylobacterium TaxID=407 RepID=UPI00104D1474|nr:MULTISPECIES: hypothetical protein [Methylobacterium]MDR7036132.1 hypothetical protein [Methylobacterium sp. BE186]